jgi:hypothetical protein
VTEAASPSFFRGTPGEDTLVSVNGGGGHKGTFRLDMPDADSLPGNRRPAAENLRHHPGGANPQPSPEVPPGALPSRITETFFTSTLRRLSTKNAALPAVALLEETRSSQGRSFSSSAGTLRTDTGGPRRNRIHHRHRGAALGAFPKRRKRKDMNERILRRTAAPERGSGRSRRARRARSEDFRSLRTSMGRYRKGLCASLTRNESERATPETAAAGKAAPASGASCGMFCLRHHSGHILSARRSFWPTEGAALFSESFRAVRRGSLPFGECFFPLGDASLGAPSLREGHLSPFGDAQATGALLAFLALLGTLPPEELFRTLGRFGVPPKLLLLFHFTHRYAFSSGRGERIFKAMRLRGLPRTCRGRAFADGIPVGSILGRA